MLPSELHSGLTPFQVSPEQPLCGCCIVPKLLASWLLLFAVEDAGHRLQMFSFAFATTPCPLLNNEEGSVTHSLAKTEGHAPQLTEPAQHDEGSVTRLFCKPGGNAPPLLEGRAGWSNPMRFYFEINELTNGFECFVHFSEGGSLVGTIAVSNRQRLQQVWEKVEEKREISNGTDGGPVRLKDDVSRKEAARYFTSGGHNTGLQETTTLRQLIEGFVLYLRCSRDSKSQLPQCILRNGGTVRWMMGCCDVVEWEWLPLATSLPANEHRII